MPILIWSGLLIISTIGLVKSIKKHRKEPPFKYFARKCDERMRVKELKTKSW